MRKLAFILFASLLLGSCTRKNDIEINCATFNVRYDNPQDSLNNWQYRKDSVFRFILDRQLDLVGMQEVLHDQFEDLKDGLPGYAAIGVGRDDGMTAGEYAPLFYRSDRLEVLDSKTFWLSQSPDSVGMKGWDAVCTRIATWAKFKDKASGKIFMAVNTHFDHIGTEARKNSALLIISKIKDIVGNEPAILTGDFNVSDQSETYETITTNEFVLKDAHKIANEVGGVSYTFHDFGRVPKAEREKIDFIFVTPQMQVLKSDIPACGNDSTGYLSDHCPQIAVLRF